MSIATVLVIVIQAHADK